MALKLKLKNIIILRHNDGPVTVHGSLDVRACSCNSPGNSSDVSKMKA